MKFKQEIIIQQPIEKVIELFNDAENLKKWMPGLVSFEHLNGNPGEVGAQSKLIFKMGKRNIEMIETIEVSNLPHELSGTYHAGGVFNRVKNFFEPIDSNNTLYQTENEFQFKGFMKIIAFLMPGAFKKQSFKYMTDFKEFAENS